MASLQEHFYYPNYHLAASNKDAMFIGKNYRITILSEVLIRFEFSQSGQFEDRPTELASFRAFPAPRFNKKEDDRFLIVTTKYFKLEYEKNKPFYGSKLAPDQNLKVTLNNTDKFWYFGAAEARNFKGTTYSLDNELGHAKYLNGLYSTDGFVSIDDSKSLLFNQDGSFGKRSDARIDTYLFMYRKDFGFCLRDYFKLTGKPSLIPRYALGNWWHKNISYSAKSIENLIWNFNKDNIPLSVFLFGKTWHVQNKNTDSGFTFNYKLIENPRELINNLHEKKIRVGLSVNPVDGIYPEEIAYKRFKERVNYPKEGVIPFNVFDKETINAYFTELINPLYEIGTDFFWIDYNNIKDLYTLRALNYYHFNDFKKFREKRGIILSRNGLIAAHKYPILYSGRTIVGWENLDMLPEFNSKSSNMGISFWSHDIGGYKEGIEDPELYMRFIEFGVYSPILRLSSDASHYYKREPWLWDVKTFSVVKEYLHLRHELIPYIYTESYKYHQTGLPLVQPIYYKYPEIYDEPLYKNEYYFGTELFIAPITTKKDILMNRTVQRIFLPDGVWYDFKTGKKFMGGKRYVTFYKDEDYPVFAKRGTIIPKAILEEDNINDTDAPKKMEIVIFPGRSNTYKLYEDDGISSMFEEGYYLITDIDYNYQSNNFTVIIRPVEGKTEIVPSKRDFKIRFRNTRKPEDVILYIGEEKITTFKSYIDGNDFVVEILDVNPSKQVSLNCKGKDIEIAAERIVNEDIDSILSDLQINTSLKETISSILFSDKEIKRKRIEIRKLKRKGLHGKYVNMFMKLLEYLAEL